jgi:hypothetical protein
MLLKRRRKALFAGLRRDLTSFARLQCHNASFQTAPLVHLNQSSAQRQRNRITLRRYPMTMTGFWRHFEEPAAPEGPIVSSETMLRPTQTRQREEPDQRKTLGLACGTTTNTAQREEKDQDVSAGQYRAIPSSGLSGTRTLTEQREEPDQDASTAIYSALPARQA